MKKITIIIILIFSVLHMLSAQNCEVLLPSLKGNYEGKCKNGLAQGKGKAIGIDTYVGRFKKGLPNGNGTYTFSVSGDIYVGAWKAGKREGKGVLYLKGEKNNTIKGFWKEDKYLGKTMPVAFKVVKKTNVSRYTFNKKGAENKVVFTIAKGGGVDYPIEDLYFSNSSGNDYKQSQYYGFDDVKFPFDCTISYITRNATNSSKYDVHFDFTIYEPGSWEVRIYN